MLPPVTLVPASMLKTPLSKFALPPNVRLLFDSSITELPLVTLSRVPLLKLEPAKESPESCTVPPLVTLVTSVVEFGWLLVQVARPDIGGRIPIRARDGRAGERGGNQCRGREQGSATGCTDTSGRCAQVTSAHRQSPTPNGCFGIARPEYLAQGGGGVLLCRELDLNTRELGRYFNGLLPIGHELAEAHRCFEPKGLPIRLPGTKRFDSGQRLIELQPQFDHVKWRSHARRTARCGLRDRKTSRTVTKKITFSTDILPPGLDEWKRRSLWHDRYVEVIGPCDVAFLPDQPMAVDFNFLPTGAIGIGEYHGTMTSISRNRSQAAAISSPIYHLSYNTGRAPWSSDIGRRESPFPSGRLMLFDPDTPNTMATAERNSFRGLQIPKQRLLECVSQVDDLVCTVLPDTTAARVLKGYVDLLCTEDGLTDDPALSAHLETTLLDLSVLALGASRDVADLACQRGLRAARLQEVLAKIRTGFADPAFSSERVARELGVTSRYVNKLLFETGETLADRVMELRLQKARAMLASPRYDRMKVSDIALACGFNEVSYFNRCFRRRFGASPLQHRGGGD
jgi:AraC-like DNA-binding protein